MLMTTQMSTATTTSAEETPYVLRYRDDLKITCEKAGDATMKEDKNGILSNGVLLDAEKWVEFQCPSNTHVAGLELTNEASEPSLCRVVVTIQTYDGKVVTVPFGCVYRYFRYCLDPGQTILSLRIQPCNPTCICNWYFESEPVNTCE